MTNSHGMKAANRHILSRRGREENEDREERERKERRKNVSEGEDGS